MTRTLIVRFSRLWPWAAALRRERLRARLYAAVAHDRRRGG